jgi:plasmid maintenance system antidote protein VapI
MGMEGKTMADTGDLPRNASVSMPSILRGIILQSGRETVTDAARLLRIGRPALSNVLNGNAELSVELAAKIEDVYRYSALALLQYQAARKLREYRETVGSEILPVRIGAVR